MDRAPGRAGEGARNEGVGGLLRPANASTTHYQGLGSKRKTLHTRRSGAPETIKAHEVAAHAWAMAAGLTELQAVGDDGVKTAPDGSLHPGRVRDFVERPTPPRARSRSESIPTSSDETGRVLAPLPG